MENITEIVGKNLQALRKAKGMTQMQLAEEINYSDKSISKWENGYALPTVDILLDFAAYYGVTLDYLVTEQKEEDIALVVDEEQRKHKHELTTKQHNILIMAMVAFTITLIVVVALVADFLLDIYIKNGVVKHYWPILVWMIPAIALPETFLARRFFKNDVLLIVLSSIFLWGLIGGTIFHCIYWLEQNVWYIVFIGIPIEIIMVLIYLSRTRHRHI